MCLTLPAQVKAVNGLLAEIDYNGQQQVVKVGTAESLSPGDFVLFTGDYLIKKISAEEAQEIEDLLTSYPRTVAAEIRSELKEIFERAANSALTKADLQELLSLSTEADLLALYSEANVVRLASIKNHICIHGIIEFSNYCKNDCHYCGLRKSNQCKQLYRMSPEEIIQTAVSAVNDKGYKLLVLQSGEDDWYTIDKLVEIVKEIKKQCRLFLYLSIGDRSRADYEQLKAAGVNGVLYRFETSNAELYEKLHPAKGLADRLDHLRAMKDLGFVISTGCILGLPDQTVEDLANDLWLLKEFDTFMPSFGPLVPSSNTPLATAPAIIFEQVLKFIATCRLLLPTARIPVTTAMETLGGGEAARQKCFLAGANSVMFNLTPEAYRRSYQIYDDKFYDSEKKYERWALFKGELSYEMMERELKILI